MKVDFNDNKWGNSIELIPESVEEVAALLRFASNTKKAVLNIYVSFANETPYCMISTEKVKESVQTNSLSKK